MRAAVVLFVMALQLGASPWVAAQQKRAAPAIVAPGSRVVDKTIAEWAEVWWQWLLAAPNVHDPALDQTGEKCQYGQSGPVWFLAGGYASADAIRRCTVPAGKYVLFPVAVQLVRPLPLNDVDCGYALNRAADSVDAMVKPYATIDGRAVADIHQRRERTGACFDPSATGRKVSSADGYWVMLEPLAVGKHVLKFGNDESGPDRISVTLLLAVAKDLPPATFERWPDAAAVGGVGESPTKPGEISWQTAGVVMPVSPTFDSAAVMRRAAGLLARDARYTRVRTAGGPLGSQYWISIAPRDVAEFDARSPEIAREFHSPVWISSDPPKDGKVRILAGNLVIHGPGRAHGLEVSRDVQRVFLQAIDKSVPVSDHEIRAAFASTPPTWEQLTRHRPPKPEPTAEQKAATQEVIREFEARTARASEATQPAPGRIYLKAEFAGTVRISPDGMRAEHCCGGAFATAKATRAHAYGKHYFEAELKTPPSRPNGETFTNVGLVYGDGSAFSDEESELVFEHGEITRHAGGTVVGIAADLDARRLHIHINGVWQGGAPGSGTGRELKPARAYTAAVTMSTTSGRQEPDAWTVNFGASAFRYPVPAGYAPYDVK